MVWAWRRVSAIPASLWGHSLGGSLTAVCAARQQTHFAFQAVLIYTNYGNFVLMYN